MHIAREYMEAAPDLIPDETRHALNDRLPEEFRVQHEPIGRPYSVAEKRQQSELIAGLIVKILKECSARIKDAQKLGYDIAKALRDYPSLPGLYARFGRVIKLALDNKRWQDDFLQAIRQCKPLFDVLQAHGFNLNDVGGGDAS